MCLLRLENNLHVRFDLKTIFFLSNEFASPWNQFSYYWMCSLRFENKFLTIERARFAWLENPIIKAFVRFRFYSIAVTNSNIQVNLPTWCMSLVSQRIYGLG